MKMPKTIYEEDEVIISKDFFSNYNTWEIGKALREVLRYVEKELLKQEENEDIKATLKAISQLKNCIYQHTGYSEIP